MDRAIVRHNQQHPFLRVKGDSRRQIDDIGGMLVNLQIAGGGFPGGDDRPAGAEDVFLPMIHHLIGAGAFRVGVGYHIVREQIIFQVGIRHGLRIQRLHIFRFGKGVVPAGLGVRIVRGRHIAVFRHIFAQFRHQIIAVEVLNRRPPAEVVEAVVAHAHLFTVFEADNLRHPPFNADRHIADVEDFGVRPQTTCGFRHNRRRVGVVKHPGVRRIFFHIIHQLQHAADRAHTVGDPARSAGLLAQHTVA